MRNKLPEIVFNKPFIAGKELYYIAEAVTKAHLSGNGSFTKRCHEWLQTHLGCVRAFLTHSCTTALEMAAILSDIKVGEEVILPSFTFVSTANAFVLRGAVPVFVDIRPETLNINEDLLAARGRSTFSELRWYPPMEAAKGSLSWVFRAKQPESVRTGP